MTHDPEAPGQPGRGEDGSGGCVEALARVLRSVGVEIGYAGADTYRTVVAERILASPGPLLESLAQAGVLRDRADVWDEGFDAGHQAARAVNPEWPAQPSNPYREDRSDALEEGEDRG